MRDGEGAGIGRFIDVRRPRRGGEESGASGGDQGADGGAGGAAEGGSDGGGGESCLHLCVKYNRVEAMKVILQFLEEGDDRLVNWNTVLHLAVVKKQLQVCDFFIFLFLF